MSTLSRLRQGAALALVMSALAGCQALLDPNGTQSTVEGVINSDASDRAMSALTRGDYSTAERYALTALRYNPRDGIGLLAAGLSYQGLGRYDLARQYYEVIITSNIPGSIMTPGDGGVAMPRSIMDIARANMAAIDKMTGRYVPRSAAESGRMPGASAVGAPPLPFGETAPLVSGERPQAGSGALRPIGADAGTRAVIGSAAEANAVGRFRILKQLLDEGLITPDEYRTRRAANTGALLPYTGQAPSVGLDRPIPADNALSARLRALTQNLEGRAITQAEHAAERSVILDALLPAKPRRTEVPPLPPRDLLEAGQAVGRVERLLGAGLISAEEASKEKAAIDQRYNTQMGSQVVEGSVTGLRPASAVPPPPAKTDKASPAKATGKWGVALASAGSEDEARTLWDGIKRKFPEELGKYEASFRSNAEGSKWRVLVGPLASKSAATKLCKTLKLHRQACDSASM